MAKSLNDLINRADIEIEKKAASMKKSAHQNNARQSNSEETIKIAEMLMQDDTDFRNAVPNIEPVRENGFLKIAQSIAVVEMLNNIDLFDKIENFEKIALEKGFSQEEVDEYVVKNLY